MASAFLSVLLCTAQKQQYKLCKDGGKKRKLAGKMFSDSVILSLI